MLTFIEEQYTHWSAQPSNRNLLDQSAQLKVIVDVMCPTIGSQEALELREKVAQWANGIKLDLHASMIFEAARKLMETPSVDHAHELLTRVDGPLPKKGLTDAQAQTIQDLLAFGLKQAEGVSFENAQDKEAMLDAVLRVCHLFPRVDPVVEGCNISLLRIVKSVVKAMKVFMLSHRLGSSENSGEKQHNLESLTVALSDFMNEKDAITTEATGEPGDESSLPQAISKAFGALDPLVQKVQKTIAGACADVCKEALDAALEARDRAEMIFGGKDSTWRSDLATDASLESFLALAKECLVDNPDKAGAVCKAFNVLKQVGRPRKRRSLVDVSFRLPIEGSDCFVPPWAYSGGHFHRSQNIHKCLGQTSHPSQGVIPIGDSSRRQCELASLICVLAKPFCGSNSQPRPRVPQLRRLRIQRRSPIVRFHTMPDIPIWPALAPLAAHFGHDPLGATRAKYSPHTPYPPLLGHIDERGICSPGVHARLSLGLRLPVFGPIR